MPVLSHRTTRLTAAVLTSLAIAACAPRGVEGASQVVQGLKFDYGLVAEPAPAAPPASHPDPGMHGGAPARSDTYHLVLSVADARTGAKADLAQVLVGLSGPGHPGTGFAPMDPMTVNGQATWGHYLVLPEPGRYQLEFRIPQAGGHPTVKARFVVQRPT